MKKNISITEKGEQ